jgi:hypothetical protein
MSRRWERVARCFLSAIMGARANWGRTLPAALGFIECGDEAELLAIESALKSEGGSMASTGGSPSPGEFIPEKV